MTRNKGLLLGGIIAILAVTSVSAYAQTDQSDPIQSGIALTVAIGSLLGVTATIITTVVALIRSKTGDKIISDHTANQIGKVTDSLKQTDNWTLNIEKNQVDIHQKMSNILEVVENLTLTDPDKAKVAKLKGELDGYIKQATQEVQYTEKELTQLHEQLPTAQDKPSL